MAQIVGRLDGLDVAVDVLGEAPENPGLGVVPVSKALYAGLKPRLPLQQYFSLPTSLARTS
jgi:hypothetical protein